MSSTAEYKNMKQNKVLLDNIKKVQGRSAESVKYRDDDEHIINMISQIMEKLGIDGVIKPYGSRLHGIANPKSDLDITLLGDMAGASQQAILNDFLPEFRERFQNVRFIRNAKVPLLSATDRRTGMEIDFCIGNHLGIQKSELLRAYCHCDERVRQVGIEVKEWADARQLKGLHFLNSYTYVIMVIHYLQTCNPPVVPNLQADELGTPWVSRNSQSIEDLLLGFFEHFGNEFNWEEDAVCPRETQAGAQIKKVSLNRNVRTSQWYIVDPLESGNFNNAKCTAWGQAQILREMQETASNLGQGKPGRAPYGPLALFLRCRTKHKISESALRKAFGEFGITEITSPRQGEGRNASVHLHFPDQESLERALTKTGENVDWDDDPIALHIVSCRLCTRTSPVPDTTPQLEVLQRLLHAPEATTNSTLNADAPEFVPPARCAEAWQQTYFPNLTAFKTTQFYTYNDIYRMATEQGDAEAQGRLANGYMFGAGVAQDMPEAVKFYKLAADQGHAEAQKFLADCYRLGKGVAKDMPEAVKFYQLAADQGHAGAQTSMAYCYHIGKGVAQDMPEAVKFYKLAADQGHAGAQTFLADCYRFGMGVAKDMPEAVKFYKLAADRGQKEAQWFLANCYELGKGVAQDIPEAVKFYKLAADQGHPEAQFYLAACYQFGEGVAQDFVEAVKLYKLAADQGHARAKRALADQARQWR